MAHPRRRTTARVLLGLFCLACGAATGRAIATVPTEIRLFAGGVGDGAPALLASLREAYGIATGENGVVYVADAAHNRIRQIAADGTISTVAGSEHYGFNGDGQPATAATLSSPYGVAADSGGNLFIADTKNNRIRKVSNLGVISTIAGVGVAGFSGDGGPATAAKLSAPVDVSVGSDGGVFIADLGNNRVREILPDGTMRTVAGDGVKGYSGDGGDATHAHLNWPWGVSIDPSGAVLIADTGNHRVRKVAGGRISTLAGNGRGTYAGDNGEATRASLYYPWSATPDGHGNTYIADLGNSRVRRVDTRGVITTYAGSSPGFSGDGGSPRDAKLSLPSDVAFDSSGGVVIADPWNFRIRRVTQSGAMSTIGGNGISSPVGDGGLATSATLGYPGDIELDTQGNVFVADAGTYRVRRITPSGVIATVAGKGTRGYSGDGGPGVLAQLAGPQGLAFDRAGNLFIADTPNSVIRRLSPNGTIVTAAGTGTSGYSGDGGRSQSARLYKPGGLAIDPSGAIYVADQYNNRIRKIVPGSWIITTIAGNGGKGFSGDGGSARSAMLNLPRDVALDAAGNLYVADSGNNRIRKITPAGIISTVAGDGTRGYNGDGIPALVAELATPTGIAFDAPSGSLIVSDTLNNRVRVIDSLGIIRTVAGAGVRGAPVEGAPASATLISYPFASVADSAGNLLVAEALDNKIFRVAGAIPRL